MVEKAQLICAGLLSLLLCSVVFGSTGDNSEQVKPHIPKLLVSCITENHPWEVTDAKTKKVEEIDDWYVNCAVSRDEKLLWGCNGAYSKCSVLGEIVLAHPTEFRDAMAAIDEFRKVRAAQIVKGDK